MINIVTVFVNLFIYLSPPQPPQHAARGGDTGGSRRNAEVAGDGRAALKQLSHSAGLLPAHKCIRFR